MPGHEIGKTTIYKTNILILGSLLTIDLLHKKSNKVAADDRQSFQTQVSPLTTRRTCFVLRGSDIFFGQVSIFSALVYGKFSGQAMQISTLCYVNLNCLV